MIRFRTFRNGDPPGLAELWNRGTPGRGVVRPLNPHEFDAQFIGRIDFDAQGLIVAEHDGRIIGMAHAGFGPESAESPCHRLNHQMGTVAMLIVEPGQESVAPGLFAEAEAYLRRQGAQVLYAGGQSPLNPFYWGSYGGSEFAGILESHEVFRKAATDSGFVPVSTTVLLDIDLARPEHRDPKAAVIRRQSRTEVVQESMPLNWWEAIALGATEISRFRLVSRIDDTEFARAAAWDMAAFGRSDGKARTGIIGVEVPLEHRRKGYGRFLIGEILRHVKGQWGEIVSVQTNSSNLPALGLYLAAGFEPVEAAILYRRPGL